VDHDHSDHRVSLDADTLRVAADTTPTANVQNSNQILGLAGYRWFLHQNDR
jgi:hypothetical protein